MAERSQFDAIVQGDTPTGSWLAALLAEQGFSVALLGPRNARRPALAVVRNAELRGLGLTLPEGSIPLDGIESVTLAEFETFTQALSSERLVDEGTSFCVVDVGVLIDEVLRGTNVERFTAGKTEILSASDRAIGMQIGRNESLHARLTIVTGDSATAAAHAVEAGSPVQLVSDNVWRRAGKGSGRQIQIRSAELGADGSAWLLQGSAATLCRIVMPLDHPDRSGIPIEELREHLFARLHALNLVPPGPAEEQDNRTAPGKGWDGVPIFEPGRLDLSPVWFGLSPSAIVAELGLARIAAGVIGDSLRNDRLTGASFSRLERQLREIGRVAGDLLPFTIPSPESVARQTDILLGMLRPS